MIVRAVYFAKLDPFGHDSLLININRKGGRK